MGAQLQFDLAPLFAPSYELPAYDRLSFVLKQQFLILRVTSFKGRGTLRSLFGFLHITGYCISLKYPRIIKALPPAGLLVLT